MTTKHGTTPEPSNGLDDSLNAGYDWGTDSVAHRPTNMQHDTPAHGKGINVVLWANRVVAACHVYRGASGDLYRWDPDQLIAVVDHDDDHLRRWLLTELGAKYRPRVAAEILDTARVAAPHLPRGSYAGFKNGDLAVEGLTLSTLGQRAALLLAPSPDRPLTSRCPHPLTPSAEADTTSEWLKRHWPDAEPQQMVGYALLGVPGPQQAMVMEGPARTSKSTFAEHARKVIGPARTAAVSPQDLAERFGGYLLVDTVANVVADVDTRPPENTGKLKSALSGDTILVERKYRDPFAAVVHQPTLWALNEMWSSRDVGSGMRRRLHIVPSPTVIGEPDPAFTRTLEGEAAGFVWLSVLAAVTHGVDALTYQPSPSGELRLADWISNANSIQRFITNRIELHPPGTPERGYVLTQYRTWCRDTGERALRADRLQAGLLELSGVRLSDTTDMHTGKRRTVRRYSGFVLTDTVNKPTTSDPRFVLPAEPPN